MINRNRLYGKIVERGLTQGEVSKMIGISENTFSARMNGRSFFDTKEVEELCVILGITSDVEKAQIFLHRSSQYRDENAK